MVKHRVVEYRCGHSILVECPLCGEWGVLHRSGVRMSGCRYVVFHEGKCRCNIAPSSPYQPKLDEIYRRVREML